MAYNKSEIKKEFSNLTKIYETDDKLRDEIINGTRIITKLSKNAIYSIHREEFEEAKKLLNDAEVEIKKATKTITNAKMDLIFNLRSGLEEYVEAKLFFEYNENKKIPTIKNLSKIIEIPYETYLSGMCDFTGELSKMCVLLATKNKIKKVIEIKELIEDIYGFYLQFDFRSSELRKKFDSLKYNLNKIESIIYDLSLKK